MPFWLDMVDPAKRDTFKKALESPKVKEAIEKAYSFIDSLEDDTFKWDERYLDLAEHISSWSKDPSTQIGAVVVGDHGQVLAQGYNGFPRGVDDSPERYNNREEKLRYVVHAEQNCIYNASLSGTSLKGSTIYIHGLPLCHECAKGVIQSGIKRVVFECPEEKMSGPWGESFATTKKMLQEAGVTYSYFECA